MMDKVILLLLFLGTLTACARTTAIETVAPTSIEPTPGSIQTAPATETAVSPSNTQSFLPSPTSESYLETADLANFVSAWNSGEVEKIRSFYTQDARYYPESEMQNLHNQQPIDVLVSDPFFVEKVAAHDGMTMRILSDPWMIYGKLAAFLYRWEDDTEGYDGAALLRYEGDKIFLHSFIESSQLTPNPADGTNYVEDINMDNLMQVWANSDQNAAQEIYTADPVILSDEDLAQAGWRDFSVHPGINQLLTQFSGWKPTIIETPKRIGDLVIFAWHWEAFDYPKGYGVRLVQFKDAHIATDIRYAIRPWEANGKPFMNP
jgi:hypothetical protein